jgi:hypothetical protein
MSESICAATRLRNVYYDVGKGCEECLTEQDAHLASMCFCGQTGPRARYAVMYRVKVKLSAYGDSHSRGVQTVKANRMFKWQARLQNLRLMTAQIWSSRRCKPQSQCDDSPSLVRRLTLDDLRCLPYPHPCAARGFDHSIQP